jgi:hypothetical protein
MTLDEKILSYLDGSLSDTDSAELMHSLSVSPEKRVVFEQFVQLQTLTASARHPFEVPQEIESALASKIPALGVHDEKRRSGFLFFNRTMSTIFRWAAVLLLLIGAVGLYYFNKSTDNIAQKISENESITSDQLHDNITTPSVSTQSVAPLKDIDDQKQISQTHHKQPIIIRNAAKDITDKINLSSEISHSIVTDIDTPEPIRQSISSIDLNALRLQNTSFPLRPIRDLPIIQRGNYSRSAYIPIAVRFFGTLGGQSYIRERIGNSYFARTEMSLLAGIDYLIDDQWSLGIEAGQAAIAHINGFQQVDKSGSVIGITSGSSVRSSEHWYINAMARHIFLPESYLRFETSIGGGIAFDNALTPIVAASVMKIFPLTEKMHLYAGANFAGSFTQVIAAENADMTGIPEYLPRAFTTTSEPANQTVFTPTFTLRAGIRYTPW